MEDIALELGDDIELPRFFIVEKDALRSCQVRCQWFLDFQPPADCGPLAPIGWWHELASLDCVFYLRPAHPDAQQLGDPLDRPLPPALGQGG